MNYKRIVLGISVLAVLGLLFFPTGPAIKAITDAERQVLITQLQQQIALLLAQVAELQAQQGITPAWCHTFNTNLGYANSGTDEVTALHAALQKENISYSPDDNNSYTEATGAAVVQFQAKYGILQTGYVGPLTRAKLNALYECRITPPTIPPIIPPTILPLPPTPTQPSITILSPNGGETLTIGQIYNVKWTKQGSFPADAGYVVALLKGGQFLYEVASSFKSYGYPSYDSSGHQQYYWQIPNLYGVVSGNDYKIEVKVMTANGLTELVKDQSDNYFSIVVTPTTCVSNWACTAWSSCANNQQTRSCADSNNCGVMISKLSETQSCTTAQPSITVLSPNGGERYAVKSVMDGNAIIVRWQTINMSLSQELEIRLRGKPSSAYPDGRIHARVRRVSNKDTETMPPTFVYTPPGDYKVEIETYVDNVLVFDSSDDYFKIVQPSLTILSPNGGEVWKVGQTYNITWEYDLISPSTKFYLSITDDSPIRSGTSLYRSYNISTVLISDRTYSWTIPRELEGYGFIGNKFKIYSFGLYDNRDDVSDNYFSIVAPTTTCVPNWTCTAWNACASDQQTRSCADSNNCGVMTNPPPPSGQACVQSNDVVLVIDRSGSMAGKPFTDAQIGAKAFIDNMNLTSDQVGVVSFSSDVTLDAHLTHDGDIAKQAIDSLRSSGRTNIAEAIKLAQDELTSSSGEGNPIIVLLSDGLPNEGGDPLPVADKAKSEGIRIITIGLGKDNEVLLKRIASKESDYYFAPDSEALRNIYLSIIATLQSSTPQIILSSPNGGNELGLGGNVKIKWRSSALLQSDTISIFLETNTSTNYRTIVANLPCKPNSYEWTIPSDIPLGNNMYKVRVEVYRNGSLYLSDKSDSYFSIIKPEIVVTYPNGGESFRKGNKVTVSWSSKGLNSSNIINISGPGIYAQTSGDRESYDVYVSERFILGFCRPDFQGIIRTIYSSGLLSVAAYLPNDRRKPFTFDSSDRIITASCF
ncbi:MAG: VWA domain-containing protein [Candidatus Staskawiczbacteria bacterium]|nr:VWA domain-containing protein [Candidatus Staskawiczbacteria bacterium]